MALRHTMQKSGNGYFKNTLDSFQSDKKVSRSPKTKSNVKSYVNELIRYGFCYAPNSKSLIECIRNVLPNIEVFVYNDNTVQIFMGLEK